MREATLAQQPPATSGWQDALVDGTLAAATAAACLAMAWTDAEPNSAAEARLLAVVAAGALFMTFSVTRNRLLRMFAPLGIAVAVWTLPNAPIRGLSVTALLAGAIALASWDLVARERTVNRTDLRANPKKLVAWGALVLAIQLTLGSELILALVGSGTPRAGTVLAASLSLVVVPVAMAIGLVWLAQSAGSDRTLLVLAALLFFGGLLDPFAVAVVAALVLGSALTRNTASSPVYALTAGAAVAALAATVTFGPVRALPAILAGLAIVLVPGQERRTRSWFALLLVAAGMLALVGDNRPWPQVGADLVLLLPWFASLALPDATRRGWLAATATALAIVGSRTGAPDALLPAAGLLALGGAGFPPSPANQRRPVWSRAVPTAAIVMSTLALLAGGYPWLQPTPATSIEAAVTEVADLTWRANEELLLAWPPVVLASDTPQFVVGCDELALPLEGTSLRTVLLTMHSMLDHAAELATGEVAGSIELATATGPVFEADILVGRDTGEWSATATGGAAAPPTFAHWVSADGKLGRRFRSRIELQPADDRPTQTGSCRLTITRSEQLPEATALTLYRLSIAPGPAVPERAG